MQTRRLLPLALTTLFFLPALATAQEQPPEPPPHARQPAAEPPSPAVTEWTAALAGRLTDEEPAVRRSAQAALLALGRAALPTLHRMAGGADEAAATAAAGVIERIYRVGARHRPGAGRRGPRDKAQRGRRGPERGAGRGRAGPPEGRGRGAPPRGADRRRGPPERRRAEHPGRGPKFRPGAGPRGRAAPGRERGRDAGPRGRAAPRRDLLAGLDLDDATREEVRKVLDAHRREGRETMRGLRSERAGPEQARAAHEKLRQKLIDALAPHLTDEQLGGVKEALERHDPRRVRR